MKTIISSFLLIGGIILMAGSAGDCDGKCVENSNTIAEMLMYAGMGLTLFLTGAIVAIRQ